MKSRLHAIHGNFGLNPSLVDMWQILQKQWPLVVYWTSIWPCHGRGQSWYLTVDILLKNVQLLPVMWNMNRRSFFWWIETQKNWSDNCATYSSCQKIVKAVQTKLKIIQSSTKISFETVFSVSNIRNLRKKLEYNRNKAFLTPSL